MDVEITPKSPALTPPASTPKASGRSTPKSVSDTGSAARSEQATAKGETAVAQSEEEPPLKVGWLTRAVVKRPCCVAFLILIVAFAFSLLGMAVAAQRHENFGDAITFISGDKVPSHPDTLRTEAFSVMVDDGYDGKEEDNDDPVERERQYAAAPISLVYEDLSAGANMLTRENVKKIAKVERAILDEPAWRRVCQLRFTWNKQMSACAKPTTILNTLFVNADEHEAQCKKGFCEAGPAASDTVCGDGEGRTPYGEPPCVSMVYDWREGTLADEADWPSLLRTRVCGNEFEETFVLDKAAIELVCKSGKRGAARTLHTRSRYLTGQPFDGFRNREDREREQDELLTGDVYDTSSPGGQIEAALQRATEDVSATPYQPSASYVGAAQGERNINVLITNNGVQRFLRVLTFDVLWALISFLFVYVYIASNVGSFALALAGLVEIMLSLPLAYFFYSVLMNQQKLEFTSFLTVYLIMCIGADDIFVFYDSWRESLTQPERISGSLETRLKWTYYQAGMAMLITTLTTVICLTATAFSSIPSISSFGSFTALVVLFNFLLVMTWFPAVVVAHAVHLKACCRCCSVGGLCREQEAKPGEPAALPRHVRFLRERALPKLFEYRYALLGFSACATVAMVVTFAVLFQVDTGGFQFLVQTNPWQVATDTQDESFYVPEDWQYSVQVVYGLDTSRPISYPADGQILRTLDDDDGTLHYLSNFTLTERLQEALVADCDEARKDRRRVHEREAYCVLNELKAWREDAFPYEDERALRKALDSFYNSPKYLELALAREDFRQNTGFVPDGDDGIKALWVSYNSTIPREATSAPQTIAPYYADWDAVRADCAFECFHVLLGGPVFSSANWLEYRYFERLLEEFGQSIGISLLCATVLMLLSTRNWIVSACVMVTIMSTVVSALACVLAAGNKIGSQEATYTVLTIGLSIDYAVHLSHFYVHAAGSRLERVRESITKVGASVIGGAITTGAAGLPLFATSFTFFFKFGFFILFTSLWAITYSFTMLLPLLLILGPEGRQGSFDMCTPARFRAKESGDSEAAAAPAAPVSAVRGADEASVAGGDDAASGISRSASSSEHDRRV